MRTTDSVIHCAASLNRKSEKSCLNVNLRGTLEVIQLAMRARDQHGLRRFSQVSTVAVAGQRRTKSYSEDAAIDWDRSDYDPYARTKKFCEHMVRELLPDVPRTVFRPSIVLGDSRRPETTQFDMVRAFVFLAGLAGAALPPRRPHRHRAGGLRGRCGRDAAPEAINRSTRFIICLSGRESETFVELTEALAKAQGKRGPLFVPGFEKSTSKMVDALRRARRENRRPCASLLKVFLPYLVWNTVFDNTRVVRRAGPRARAVSRSTACRCCASAAKIISLSKYREWPSGASVNAAAAASGGAKANASASASGGAAGGSAAMMDLLLESWVGGLIELNKFAWMLGAGGAWKPGEPLKLLFAGYNGTRNTGSDVRVEEMLRQVRRVLGAENLALSVMTQNFESARAAISATRGRCTCPMYFRRFCISEVRRNDGVDGLRRLDVQKQVRQCAHHHDDRRTGHRRRAK